MPFPTGLRPTPRHRLAAAFPFRPTLGMVLALPTWFGVAPKGCNMEGNDVDGDCVTAEEAAAIIAYSLYCGIPEVDVPAAVAVAWATKHGVLNGADLEPVIQDMQTDGMTVNGVTYTDGSPEAIDYTNKQTLFAAIIQGPVKIGIASSQLQNVQGVGQGNGWVCTGFSKDENEDHCTGLWGGGTAADLFANVFKMPVPSGVDPTTWFWQMYTWAGYGVIDDPSLQNICGEAWLRNPTNLQMQPVGPTPGPTPTPPPGPTPTPSPIPATAGWFDPISSAAHAPSGWTTGVNAFNKEIIADEGRKIFIFPSGWNFQ
jgi:hypothetical protein